MTKGKIIVDQVNSAGVFEEGFDESLSPQELYVVVSTSFPDIRKSSQDPRFYCGTYKETRFLIRCKNVTYLGNPHPHYKKRIQISDDLNLFYETAISSGMKPLLLGVYHYKDNLLFVDFKIDTYVLRKAHNSSAHVYVGDLQAAVEDGFFQKTDYFGNVVTVIRPDMVGVFLDDVFDNIDDASPTIEAATVKNAEDKHLSAYATAFKIAVLPRIKSFFSNEPREWNGIECYKKMIDAQYRNKYQPEWAGFFLEFEFEQFLKKNHLNHLIQYAQDKTKDGIDLDLYFPTIGSYGDLKAHSEKAGGIQGNDWATVMGLIGGRSEKDHIYYIVCEHSTEKDSLHDYEVTKYWNATQKKDNLMSYSAKMKNQVRLKKVFILDINHDNRQYLTMFKQGVNNDGKPRAPKIMIDQDKIQYFIIDQMIL